MCRARFAVALALGLSSAACIENGPPPNVPTITVPVQPVAGAPLQVGPGGRSSAPAIRDGRSVGDPVDVEWHGAWYPAVLLERKAEGWLIHYEGFSDSYDEVAPASRIRDRSVEIGEEPHIDDSDP